MKMSKTLEIYRPQMGMVGFYILIQMFVMVSALTIWVLYKEDVLTNQDLYLATRIMMFNGYIVVAFVVSMLFDILISMFQWVKQRRKIKKDTNLMVIKRIARKIKNE